MLPVEEFIVFDWLVVQAHCLLQPNLLFLGCILLHALSILTVHAYLVAADLLPKVGCIGDESLMSDSNLVVASFFACVIKLFLTQLVVAFLTPHCEAFL